jgi:pyruvate/2-oxoacid:ferredoxin oxidoreductase alpha subunit
MNFQFQKENKILGVKCGYYFKGEFLSRYKNEAIQILRDRVEKSANGDWEKAKEFCSDEYKVIHAEWKKGTAKNKKTYEKKKPYYKKIHERTIVTSIANLKHRLEMKEQRKQEVMKDFDDSILEIINKIQELEMAMK